MDIEQIRAYCLAKRGASESFPFDESTLVFKVGTKIFALLSLDADFSINLKCDPEKALELREHYTEVIPGYHQNKKHWNTIDLKGSLSKSLICEWIDHSYKLVFSSLTKKEKDIIREHS